jgi:hypothetical protein
MTTPLTDGASQQEIPEEIRTVERLRGLREQVTTQMGGPEAVGAIYAAGRRTAREHIAEFVDPGSFGEIGTFATFVDKVTAPDPGPSLHRDPLGRCRPRPGHPAREVRHRERRTFGAEPAFPYLLERQRAIPVVSMVLGDPSVPRRSPRACVIS